MRWFVIVVILLMVGCVSGSIKPKFMQPGDVESIVVGKTTMADVTALFGRPQEVRVANDATGLKTMWRYQYVQRGTYELVPWLRESLSKPAIREILTVQFGADMMVQNVERLHREIRTPEEGGVLLPW